MFEVDLTIIISFLKIKFKHKEHNITVVINKVTKIRCLKNLTLPQYPILLTSPNCILDRKHHNIFNLWLTCLSVYQQNIHFARRKTFEASVYKLFLIKNIYISYMSLTKQPQ